MSLTWAQMGRALAILGGIGEAASAGEIGEDAQMLGAALRRGRGVGGKKLQKMRS